MNDPYERFPLHLRPSEARQLARESADWFTWCFWGLLLGLILTAAVWGHAIVSAGLPS